MATSLRTFALALALALCALPPQAARASPGGGDPDADRIRFGISLGGTHRYGISVEYLRGRNSVELSLGTFRWQVLTLAVTGRRYLGESELDPYVGAGLWTMLAFPGEDFGYLALARAAPGLDWNVDGRHHAGLEASLSYALAVKRPDPDDRDPLRRRFLPLPALYYKFERPR